MLLRFSHLLIFVSPLFAWAADPCTPEQFAELIRARVVQAKLVKDPNVGIVAEELSEIALVHGKRSWIGEATRVYYGRAIRQLERWAQFGDKASKRGTHMYLVQQTDVGGMAKRQSQGLVEFYLNDLDDEVYKIVEESGLGHIRQKNYRSFLVESSLSEAQFNQQVVTKLKAKLAAGMKEALPELNLDWSQWLDANLHSSSGSNYLDSHIRFRSGGQFNLDNFSEWAVGAKKRRESIFKVIQENGIDWNTLLYRIKGETADDLKSWANAALVNVNIRKRNLLIDEILAYQQDLKMADFLPFEKPPSAASIGKMKKLLGSSNQVLADDATKICCSGWKVERGVFLSALGEAESVAFTDLQGVGVQILMESDRWIASGGKTEELYKAVAQAGLRIRKSMEELELGVQKILGPDKTFHRYLTGDDAMWSFPPMTKEEAVAIEKLFKKHEKMYFAMSTIDKKADPVSMAEALNRVRQAVFAEKASKQKLY